MESTRTPVFLREDLETVSGQGFAFMSGSIFDMVACLYLLSLCLCGHRAKYAFNPWCRLFLGTWLVLQITSTLLTILTVPLGVLIFKSFLDYMLCIGLLFESVRHIRSQGYLFWFLNVIVLSFSYFAPIHQDTFFLFIAIMSSLVSGHLYLTVSAFSVLLSHIFVFYIHEHGDVHLKPVIFKLLMCFCTIIGSSSLFIHFTNIRSPAVAISIPTAMPTSTNMSRHTGTDMAEEDQMMGFGGPLTQSQPEIQHQSQDNWV